MAHPKAYTDAEKAFVREHWGQQTQEWIARQLGRDRTSVRQHAQRMGLHATTESALNAEPDGWTDRRVTLLERLWKYGHTTQVIAEKLGGGLTRNAVIGKAHRLGLSTRPPAAKPMPVQIQGPRVKTCQWPIGNPGDKDFRFCGSDAVVAGKPYCAAHCKAAYRTPAQWRAENKGEDVNTAELVATKKRLKRVA